MGELEWGVNLNDDARILLTMPHYSNTCHLLAATAFYHPCRAESKIRVTLTDAGGSLLARSFNGAWAKALDQYEAGKIDGFAMIHSDVAPDMGWLDVLHEQLIASGADIVSAVVPIKDDRGIVSTGVDDTGDPWLIRRLTMTQVSKLPTTFTDDDVGGPLVLNTGLWLVKLGLWCLEENADGTLRHRFTIDDMIRREKGRRIARVMPEDWNFSRSLRGAGLKLAATKAVKINHFGDTPYPNDQVWGWETDLQNDPREQANAVASDVADVEFPAQKLELVS